MAASPRLMDDPADATAKTRAGRMITIITVAALVLWSVAWIWLMAEADFPKSFGFTLGHGKGAVIEAFVFSYVLVERHRWWDIALFAWMWGPVLGGLGWVARKQLGKLAQTRFSLFDEAS
jgi:hypothetical protein